MLNSVVAQEAAEDHGDYVLIEQAGLRLGVPVSRELRLTTSVARLDPGPLDISATPSRGTFRPQQDFGADAYWGGGIGVRREGGGGSDRPGFGWGIDLEGGIGEREWGRFTTESKWKRAPAVTPF